MKWQNCLCFCLPTAELEDEIALFADENPDQLQNIDYIIQITADNFHDVVAQSSLTVAVFYLDCELHFFLLACQEEEANKYKLNVNSTDWL